MWSRWVIVWAVLLCGCETDEVAVLEGEAMGMRWRVQVVGGNPGEIAKAVEGVMRGWEQAASLWRNDSELAAFNREPVGKWVKLDERLWSAVTLAREIAEETDGAFDITIGPLVDLWGFGPERRQSEPSKEEIRSVMQHCGWHQLEFDEAGGQMRKLMPGVVVSLNGVVEGLALEELARKLKSMGYGDFLLELGGEVLAGGHTKDRRPWMLAIQTPGAEQGEAFSMVPLSGLSMATSGTYRHVLVRNGKQQSHLIDPQTGYPVAHHLESVTVVDRNCGRADGFATALMVLGPEKGRVVANRLGLNVVWIEPSE